MSKTNHFAPTPMGSRPTSPPPTFMSEEDKDRQALMMGPLGADKPKDTGAAGQQQLTPREQALPILSYCAASIMMTVVNKVSRGMIIGRCGSCKVASRYVSWEDFNRLTFWAIRGASHTAWQSCNGAD
jgi:GDP-mannose transporter